MLTHHLMFSFLSKREVINICKIVNKRWCENIRTIPFALLCIFNVVETHRHPKIFKDLYFKFSFNDHIIRDNTFRYLTDPRGDNSNTSFDIFCSLTVRYSLLFIHLIVRSPTTPTYHLAIILINECI